MGVRGRGRAKSSLHSPHPHPSPYFWPLTASLVQISFSPQPSAAVKIKDGGHSFREENTEHSLAKNTPALQTTKIRAIICCSCRLMGFCRRSSIGACLLVCDQLFFLCLNDDLSVDLLTSKHAGISSILIRLLSASRQKRHGLVLSYWNSTQVFSWWSMLRQSDKRISN